MDLTPYATLNVATTKDALGLITYCGDSLGWHLVDLLGRDDASFTGFSADPTGEYLIQTPINIGVNADPTQWSLSGSVGVNLVPNWGTGTDETTGATFLRQSNGNNQCQWQALFSRYHDDDEGLHLQIFRGAPIRSGNAVLPTGSAFAMYVELNASPPGHPKAEYALRLCIERGNPIRLEGSGDGTVTWKTLDVASDLGDSDDYLTANNRNLSIDVVPLSSAAYYDNLPASQTWGDPPPDTVLVVLNNGDAILKYRDDQATFDQGAVRITGTGGQFTARYAKRRYQNPSQFITNEIARFRPFETSPRCYLRGFCLGGGNNVLTPTVSDINKAYLSGSVAANPGDVDSDTGYCLHTAILSSAEIDFPRAYTGPQPVPASETYDVVSYTEKHTFDQTTFSVRSSASVTLENNDGRFSPGSGVALAVRAATLTRGWRGPGGYDDGVVGITGITGQGADGGFEWLYEGGQHYVRITVDDLARRGDQDLAQMGYHIPYDGECHYYVARQLCYKMGIGDDRLAFPWCGKGSQCAHYHLSRGTNANPLWRFQPQTAPWSALLQVRAASGEFAPDGQTVLPMYLYLDPVGNVQYFPAPLGLVQQWLNPDLTVASQSIPVVQQFSMVPQFADGVPLLNELVGGRAGTTASLANIRTPIVMEGLSPASGDVILGTSYNPTLGVNGDQNAPGYIGIDRPYYQISRLFSSKQAVQTALAVATIQTSFPSIRSNFTAHLQSQLFPLMAVTVQDFRLMGTLSPVAFYTTSVINRGYLGPTPSATTEIGARLLGQAG